MKTQLGQALTLAASRSRCDSSAAGTLFTEHQAIKAAATERPWGETTVTADRVSQSVKSQLGDKVDRYQRSRGKKNKKQTTSCSCYGAAKQTEGLFHNSRESTRGSFWQSSFSHLVSLSLYDYNFQFSEWNGAGEPPPAPPPPGHIPPSLLKRCRRRTNEGENSFMMAAARSSPASNNNTREHVVVSKRPFLCRHKL